MKRIFLAVSLVALFSFVFAQRTELRKYPPKVSEVPRASSSCLTKKKLYVSAVAGVPVGSRNGSATISCQFHTVGCGAIITPYHSTEREGGLHVCDDWNAARDAIAGSSIESCCDLESTDQPPTEETNSNCPSPTKWFDNSASCKEKRAPWVQVRGTSVAVSICGYEVFRGTIPNTTDKLLVEAYRQAIIGHVRSQIGSTVCCDQFRDAVRTGSPCDPSKDIDCDGVSNQTDTVTTSSVVLPDINIFTRASGARIDTFPEGLDPDDPDFLPDRTARDSKGVGECPCKWELIKGELKCGGGGEGRHVYLATWRCPTSKAEVITTKYAAASQPCP